MAVGDDLSRSKIGIGGRERTCFGLSDARQSKKFQKVRTVLSVSIKYLGTNVGDDCLELLKCGLNQWTNEIFAGFYLGHFHR